MAVAHTIDISRSTAIAKTHHMQHLILEVLLDIRQLLKYQYPTSIT